MKEFTFSVPQQIFFGEGSLEKLPEIAKTKIKGDHAYIISDPFLTSIGLVDRCQNYLEAQGIKVDKFTETEGNPSVETVTKAAAGYKESGAEFIVAIGGGSPMDVAKAVGVLATYGGDITDYEGLEKVPGNIVPLIAIPTTAGTGSEVTASCVITDHSRNYKLSVISPKIIPTYAVLDPTLLTTAPASVAAATGIDAMIHALEAYISKNASPFTDAMAEEALQMIGANIRAYVADRTNIEAASAMQVGCLFAGMAFAWAKLGNVHAMSHPVSAFFNVPHGVANAILLPTVVEFNALADQKNKYYKIYNCIALNRANKDTFTPHMLSELLAELNEELGIPKCLREVGVTTDKIEEMAEQAMQSANVSVNPRQTTKADLIRLYNKAF